MTAIQTIALILVALSTIKLVVLAVNPRAWYGNGNPLVKLWSNSSLAAIVFLILGAVVLNYLLQELTIVQIFAATAFVSLLSMLGLIPYSKSLLEWLRKELDTGKHVLRTNWLSTIVWIALMIWVVAAIFA